MDDGRIVIVIVTLISATPSCRTTGRPLSKGYLRGEAERDSVFVEPETFYADQRVELRLASTVTRVDTAARNVFVDAEPVGYDRLVLASGRCLGASACRSHAGDRVPRRLGHRRRRRLARRPALPHVGRRRLRDRRWRVEAF